MKAKYTKKTVKLSLKQKEKDSQTKRDRLHVLLIAVLSIIVGLLIIIMGIWLVKTASDLEQNINITIKEPAKTIDWFYNASTELSYTKSRIDDIDNQTKTFLQKHGTDETGYDPSEKDKFASLKAARYMLALKYNEMSADYNMHAADMNRSWNRSIPRQIYDIPT